MTFEVTGCEVARPSDDSDGCHLHRYLDDENYSNPDDPEANSTGWYESAGFDLIMGTAGSHAFVLRLTRNDGSDEAWVPEILDTVNFTSTAEGDDDDSASL